MRKTISYVPDTGKRVLDNSVTYLCSSIVSKLGEYCLVSRLIPGGGGALNFFFGGCVPRGFQNVGSREQFFLEKMGILGMKI